MRSQIQAIRNDVTTYYGTIERSSQIADPSGMAPRFLPTACYANLARRHTRYDNDGRSSSSGFAMPPGSYGIIAALVGLMMVFLLNAAKQSVHVADAAGSFVFRHHALMRWLGWLSTVGMPLALTVLFFLKPPQKAGDYLAVAACYALFLGLGLPLVWEAIRYALVATPQGLYCRSPWRKAQFFRWDEVESVTYNIALGWFVIHAAGRRTFRVPFILVGATQFLIECEQHLTPDQLRGASFGYKQLGRTPPF